MYKKLFFFTFENLDASIWFYILYFGTIPQIKFEYVQYKNRIFQSILQFTYNLFKTTEYIVKHPLIVDNVYLILNMVFYLKEFYYVVSSLSSLIYAWLKSGRILVWQFFPFIFIHQKD